MLAAAITDLARQCLAGLRILVVLTLILGVAYPAAVWLAGRALGDRADGQPVHVAGQVVGSRLIGQDFAGDRWFHPRPSATGYDAPAPGPSNLGPSNPELIAEIRARRAAVAEAESVTPGAVPPDAVTASASGWIRTSRRSTRRSRWRGWRASTASAPGRCGVWSRSTRTAGRSASWASPA